MGKDLESTAKELLNTPAGAKFTGKRKDIEKLVSSSDGQKVKAILQNSDKNLAAAVEKGDISTLKSALADIMKTEEGARLIGQLSEMFKE